MKRSDSNSDYQTALEKKLVGRLEKELGIPGLHNSENMSFKNAKGTMICPDIYSEEYRILGEVHVHSGKIKSAQRHKIATDIFKMLLFEQDRKTIYTKYYIVCSETEKQFLTGTSYVAAAAKLNQINIVFFPLSGKEETRLAEVMKNQDISKKQGYRRKVQ